MDVHFDPAGIAVLRPDADLTQTGGVGLHKALYKVLARSPAAVIIDLSAFADVPPLIQMTLVSLAVEAAREPATPLLLCARDKDVARDLTLNGSMMRVYSSMAEARRALALEPYAAEWVYRPLGRSPEAPSIASCHVADACAVWRLSGILMAAHAVTFDLVWMARGPYDLHLTVMLRTARLLLINVRNYPAAMAARSGGTTRMHLKSRAEAQIRDNGATACGQLVSGAGVTWWASLDCHPPTRNAL